MTHNNTHLSKTAAARMLQAGEVVAIPTETVYGLAGAINHAQALAQIFSLKQRPTHHPLIIHLAQTSELSTYARHIPAYAWALAEQFWPGPLTLVLPKTDQVSTAVTGGQDSVAIRVPNHRLAREVIAATGCALAAPSANPFGQLSPTRAEHVINYFGDLVAVLDGGPCSIGLESTIIDARRDDCVSVLRLGGLSIAELTPILTTHGVRWHESHSELRAPGKLHKHYAPRKPLFLVHDHTQLAAVKLHFNQSVMLLGLTTPSESATPWVTMPHSAAAYAQVLYDRLLAADASAVKAIVIELPPETPEWMAIHDRLRKAAYETTQCFADLTTVL